MSRILMAACALAALLALTACGTPAGADPGPAPNPTCSPTADSPPEPGVCFDADGDDSNDY